ncbi:MAG: hypothetical protein PUP93_21270 [Rhizonema sp. NSF051]|nr:hypothetical protein [Rhizonema sp. NSF051]
MISTQPTYPELSDEADEFYLGLSVDLENCSPHGFYCRVPRLKPVRDTRTYRIDLNRLESFNLL